MAELIENNLRDENSKEQFLPKDDDLDTDTDVPDGGWGWVVVMATLVFNIIYDGCSYSFGILYTDLLAYFGDTKSNTAWIGSLFFSVPLLFAPVAGLITKRLGSRMATMIGGLIAALGFALASFSNSVPMLVFLYGFVGGFGMSLPYFNSLKTVTDYFDKKLALASGIAESGAGLGTVIFAPFTEFLVSQYGWRGTLLILSGIVANIIVCGALYRPVTCKRREMEIHLELLKTDSDLTEELQQHVLENGYTVNQGTTFTTASTISNGTSKTSKRGKVTYSYYRSRLFSVPFIIFAISNFTMYFWYDVPYVFMVDRSVSSGMPTRKASYLLSIIGFVHLFSILGYGILGDQKFVNRAMLYGVSTAFCGVSILLVPLFRHFPVLAILSGSFGLFSAATEALLSCVLIDIVGKESFDNFFCGIVLFMEGVANLIGPPFAGFLHDYTGKYDATFYTAGACTVTAGVLYVTLSKVKGQQG